MKIIIEQDGVKREINGPFRICGTNHDLNNLARQISDKTFSYGWVEVHPMLPMIPNLPVLPWKSEFDQMIAGTPCHFPIFCASQQCASAADCKKKP